MKINWKEVDKNVMGAMGVAIGVCVGATILAGAGWVMVWVFKALAKLFWSVV
jgi:hypothetical protein